MKKNYVGIHNNYKENNDRETMCVFIFEDTSYGSATINIIWNDLRNLIHPQSNRYISKEEMVTYGGDNPKTWDKIVNEMITHLVAKRYDVTTEEAENLLEDDLSWAVFTTHDFGYGWEYAVA